MSVDDWLRDSTEALTVGRQIGGKVIVVGSSMGGDLALWLATQKQADVAAYVLFSCAVQPIGSRAEMLLWPWPLPNIILRAIIGKHNVTKIDQSIYPTANLALFAQRNPPRYRAVSTIKLMQMVRVVRTLPLESVSNTQLVPDAHSHMLAGDMFQPETTDEVLADVLTFLRDIGVAAPEALSAR